jgi:hypothetical protein
MKVTAETKDGGAVVLNERDGVYASYRVAEMGDPLLLVGARLRNGKHIQFFLNREIGLVVVDIVNRGGKSGTEILRRIIT